MFYSQIIGQITTDCLQVGVENSGVYRWNNFNTFGGNEVKVGYAVNWWVGIRIMFK